MNPLMETAHQWRSLIGMDESRSPTVKSPTGLLSTDGLFKGNNPNLRFSKPKQNLSRN